METITPRPKPAPPKVKKAPEIKDVKLDKFERSLPYGLNDTLPPIKLESPDGERVVEVREVKKAESMVVKGWKLTDRKKTPYIMPEHLSQRPLQSNPELVALRKSMGPKNKKRPTTRKPKNFKEKK